MQLKKKKKTPEYKSELGTQQLGLLKLELEFDQVIKSVGYAISASIARQIGWHNH
jgi:hypothetical protein